MGKVQLNSETSIEEKLDISRCTSAMGTPKAILGKDKHMGVLGSVFVGVIWLYRDKNGDDYWAIRLYFNC